jgi:hypothetical protein
VPQVPLREVPVRRHGPQEARHVQGPAEEDHEAEELEQAQAAG